MKKILLVMAVVIFTASYAYAAQQCQACGNLKADEPMKAWGSRLGNGLSNTLLGWTEIFFRPGKVVAAGGSPMVGFFRGLGNGLARTGGGVVQVLTFWTPGESVVRLDDCPLCAYCK